MTPPLRGLLLAALLSTTSTCRRPPLEQRSPPDASPGEDAAQDHPAPSDAPPADGPPADAPSPADAPADRSPDAPPPPPCKVGLDAPFTNGVCDRGARCGCRDDPRAECESIATCTQKPSGVSTTDLWVIATPACPPRPPSPCPATALEARGQPCTPDLADCVYPGNLHCYCLTSWQTTWSSPGSCGEAPLHWFCGYDDRPAACPDGIPEVGAACAPEGLLCGLAGQGCFNSYGRRCVAGTWQREGTAGECI